MRLSGIYLTLNERLYLYHYSVLRRVIAVFDVNCHEQKIPMWYLLGNAKDIEVASEFLKEVALRYKPSMIFFISCGDDVDQNIEEILGAAEEQKIDAGAAFHASLLLRREKFDDKINYFAFYIEAKDLEEIEKLRDAIESFSKDTGMFTELHIGVGNKNELLKALSLVDSISKSIPIHIFIERSTAFPQRIYERIRQNVYIHDMNAGSSEIYETRCPKCNSLIIIRNGMLPIRGKINYSQYCSNCGERIFFREPEKKWVNVNLLMKGIEITLPGVQEENE